MLARQVKLGAGGFRRKIAHLWPAFWQLGWIMDVHDGAYEGEKLGRIGVFLLERNKNYEGINLIFQSKYDKIVT